MVAAAVILPDGFTHPGIYDFKRLTAARREALVPVITAAAVAWAVAEATPAKYAK